MTLESNKTMGGIGAILMAVGFLPFAGAYTGILSLIGLILVLISVKGLSDYYKDSRIFNNVIYAIVIGIVGAVVAGILIVTAAIGLLDALGINMSNLSNWSTFQSAITNVTDINTLLPYIATIAISLILLFVFAVVAAIFLRRSMNGLSEKTHVHLFSTTGLLFLIGAVLTIVAIGLILLWIALLLMAVSFFTIPTQQPMQQTTQPPQPQQ
jgi:uncharacterized membrane protein